MRDKISSIPKVVLHDHLDGGVRANTIIDLAKRYDIALPCSITKELSEWFYKQFTSKDFDKCFKAFDVACAVMQTEDALERVAFEFAEDHALDNVIYAEARFCPHFHTQNGLTYSQIIKSIERGFDKAKQQYGIETGLLICGLYHFDDQTNTDMAKLCLEHDVVVGYDLAGMDTNGSLSKTAKFLKDNNINLTIHSGEFSAIENIKDCILNGAKRIGHACNLYRTTDMDLLREVVAMIIDKNIHIESNVSSNLALGLVDSFENHPYQRMLGDGISVALNTDDRLMLNGLTLSDEYYEAHLKNDLSYSDIVIMNLNAAKAAFASEQVKENMVEKLTTFAKGNVLGFAN